VHSLLEAVASHKILDGGSGKRKVEKSLRTFNLQDKKMPATRSSSSGSTQSETTQQVSAQSLSMPLPDTFAPNSMTQHEEWPKWIRRFERYRIATGLEKKPHPEQVSTLLYAMGECADDILATFSDIREDTSTYDEVRDKFNTYFGVSRNTIVDRAKFNRRVQQPGESINSFIQDLYKIAENCSYGQIKEELIRDRIVVGVLDESLSDRLQMKTDLKLSEAIQMARQAEARRENRNIVRGDPQPSVSGNVDFVNKSQKKHDKGKQRQKKPSQNASYTEPKRCKRCGHEQHARRLCPAREAVCGKCKKVGHFQTACLSRKVQEVTTVNSKPYDENTLHLGEIKNDPDSWKVDLEVNGNKTLFKLDTGAAVSVLSDQLPWLRNIQLEESDRVLRGPSDTLLNVRGMLSASLTYQDKCCNEKLYVIGNQNVSLLSRNACVKLQLLQLNKDAVHEVKPKPSQVDFRAEFPQLFTGLGKLKTKYKITLDENVQPVALYTPRKVPHPLLPKVKDELDVMLQADVISPVTVPTDWCSGLVPVLKPSGKVRICVDLQPLNRAVKRETHPMNSVQASLAKLSNAKVMSKLDANSGFWQIPLDDDSKLLTTFITPFGRFAFNRLPFGISSAPEIFQRTMSTILEGLDGVICHMDDVLIHGSDVTEHNTRVRAVLKRIVEAGLTLNADKCEFGMTETKFLGHIVGANGIKADPAKVKAIIDLPPPRNVTELQRLQGMTNQLARFLPNLSSLNEPLRQLLKKGNTWVWSDAQETAFKNMKKLLTTTPVLAHYDVQKPTIVAVDASQYGLGAVLLQVQEGGERRPVCYASRSLTDVEKRYAVIEKEALAATWGCEQFSEYILGLHFTLETDHKPLVPLLGQKDLSNMPVRIQRFKMRLMRYTYTVVHIPGAKQVAADALSRAPVSTPSDSDQQFIHEVHSYGEEYYTSMLPASTHKLREIADAQKNDAVLKVYETTVLTDGQNISHTILYYSHIGSNKDAFQYWMIYYCMMIGSSFLSRCRWRFLTSFTSVILASPNVDPGLEVQFTGLECLQESKKWSRSVLSVQKFDRNQKNH